ncbi:hypothetical protein QTH90_20965 [Variovorax sp. J2P1-59]|uniref:hypothetical protein n=1 Tax=Variovorax flavidus TaxID=3053501 RepID=UPI00257568C1|nr:hypothetical protein [Variovorax sp. J2P1-59]MDM0076893.1 hypothetical protein [Variovorax sp. J2P1-59]
MNRHRAFLLQGGLGRQIARQAVEVDVRVGVRVEMGKRENLGAAVDRGLRVAALQPTPPLQREGGPRRQGARAGRRYHQPRWRAAARAQERDRVHPRRIP